MKTQILDKLNELHALLAKSGVESEDYQMMSTQILHLKKRIESTTFTDKPEGPLAVDCSHYHHCDCHGKYCQTADLKK